MNSKFWLVLAVSVAGALRAGASAHAEASSGQNIYNARCAGCHEGGADRAPNRTALSAFPAGHIVDVLTNGIMQPMAAGLSDPDKQAVAAFLTSAPAAPQAATGAARPQQASNGGVDKICAVHPPIRSTGSDWTEVGFGANAMRYQPTPGLRASDVPKLKVKWSFAMPGGSMPTVIGDWLFIANRTGKLYALDAKTGCVHWVVNAQSRTTPPIFKSAISSSGWATVIGERNRTLRAIDAQTGKTIWQSDELEKHPVGGITGSPLVVGDQVFVPLTSGEEGAGRQANYSCCSFRGSLAAVDLKTGKKQWQTYVITEPLETYRRNSAGTAMQGPAGGAIWSAPMADPKRGLVYVTTGDSYTEVDTKGADAVFAFDMKTGKVRWQHQVSEKDNFITGCAPANQAGVNCPTPLGPDFDFGASPILMKPKNGKDIVLAGQKSGIVYGFDPDNGKLIWKKQVGSGSTLGGVEWGMAADPQRLYVAISDIGIIFDDIRKAQGKPVVSEWPAPAKPGLSALDPATGKVIWSTPAPKAPCHYFGDRSRDRSPGACINAQSAAPSAMPGVVFSGTVDGWFRAYEASSGKILWGDSTTDRTYDTVNAVKRQPGGSIDGLGPAIANGMVYTMSGFNGAANTGGNGINVLLAYSVDGK